MKEKTANKQIVWLIIFLVVVVLITGIVYNVVSVPLAAKTSELQTQNTQYENNIQQYEVMLAQKDSMKADIALKQKELAATKAKSSILPSKIHEDIAESTKAAAGIIAKKITVAEPVAASEKLTSDKKQLFASAVTLELDCTDKKQLSQILAYYETKSKGAYYVSSVDTKTYFAKATSAPSNLVNAKVTLNMYYFDNATSSAIAAANAAASSAASGSSSNSSSSSASSK